ncbi:hypothetical protein M427DRAFT_56352 [Gonapodya prolifera JEL478]|uniref:Uncharacterized protein n=1 Tax=Gonapodya prolifera (strain JEL478) TaxID=1344416 RepID=A0A139AI12_GONPJ|nr:hypothetical protein M427DRAFT_56352 [Gonapodya prolifera JEL478]|eukprot:KXS16065.1 hypothetical protein M427DRAFT_56352 [Gonapodya prolifera JEL478]
MSGAPPMLPESKHGIGTATVQLTQPLQPPGQTNDSPRSATKELPVPPAPSGHYKPVDESAAYSGKPGGSETTLRPLTPNVNTGNPVPHLVDPLHFYGQEVYGKGTLSTTDSTMSSGAKGSHHVHQGGGDQKTAGIAGRDWKVPIGPHGVVAQHRGGYFGVDPDD